MPPTTMLVIAGAVRGVALGLRRAPASYETRIAVVQRGRRYQPGTDGTATSTRDL